MDTNRRDGILAIAGFLALLVPGLAAAQPIVATAGTASAPCVNPADSDCTRGTLYLINGNTLMVERTFDWWNGLPNVPWKLLAHPGGTRLYATRADRLNPPASRWIDVIDLPTMTKVNTYTLAGAPMAISPDGTRLFLTTPTSIRVIDAETGDTIADVPAEAPWHVAVAPDGARFYASVGVFPSFSIAVFDAVQYVLLQAIPVGTDRVHVLEPTRDGKHLYGVANFRVLDIDPSTNTISGTITDFGGPTWPNWAATAGGRLYVSATKQMPGVSPPEGIAVIDIATRSFVTLIGILDPIFVEASADGSRVWTLALGESRVFTIDTATNRFIGSVPVPGGPVGIEPVPTGRNAALVIDQPSQGSVLQEPFALGGWAIDQQGLLPGPGVDTVHVWAFPSAGGAPVFAGADYGRPRPDVAALFGPSFEDSGYHVLVSGLPPGPYRFVAFGHSTRTGEFSIVRTVDVTIASSARLVIDTPVPNSSLPPRFTIAGWALDAGASTGTGIDAVHTWAYPASGGPPLFAGAATLGDARPDVAALFGEQFALSGYHLDVTGLLPGSYTLVVYGLSTVTGTFSVEQSVRVTVTTPQPLMFVDIPQRDATVGDPLTVAGWAIEKGAAAGTGVDVIHVWAFPASGAPTFVGAATYGLARPDVGSLFGVQYTPSGFTLSGSLAPGSYTLQVFARSTTTGEFRNVSVVPIVVQ